MYWSVIPNAGSYSLMRNDHLLSVMVYMPNMLIS